jgi:hypothetical protein
MEESGTKRAAELSMDKMEKACVALQSVSEFAYAKLAVGLFAWLMAIPNSHPSKKFTFIVRLENLNHFKNEIGTRRVRCLQQYQKEATEKYHQSVDNLCKFLLDKSFGKLLDFFRQVNALSASMPPEEVQFKSSHSKQACLLIINKFGPGVIERGLNVILRNLDKNISAESGLLPEVWKVLGTMWLEKYEKMQTLMKTCYAGSLIVPTDDVRGIISTVWDKYSKHK